jgi:transposase
MSGSLRRAFSREFKVAAVERVLAGARVREVSEDLQIRPGNLYLWLQHFEVLGAAGLRLAGRPRKRHSGGTGGEVTADAVEALGAARQRIGELERKIGQQGLELDFFRRALRRVGDAQQPSAGCGGRASMRSSKR